MAVVREEEGQSAFELLYIVDLQHATFFFRACT